MNTTTLRHLCDAMDALDMARGSTMNGFLEDTIERTRARVADAMADVIDEFDIQPSDTDPKSWREGYEAALEDHGEQQDVLPDVVTGRPADERLADAIDSLWFRDMIDENAYVKLNVAFAANNPVASVMKTARGLYSFALMSGEAFEVLLAAAQ